MLVDPINFNIDRETAGILTLIGCPAQPLRLSTGFFEIGHFNMDYCLPGGASFDGKKAAWREYPDISDGDHLFGCYGVCDSPEQFAAHPIGQWIVASARKFAVSFTRIRKDEQPEDGGWRWHKWGEYIGEKSPQYEYIYDEGSDIVEVYCYHIYECMDAAKALTEAADIGLVLFALDSED